MYLNEFNTLLLNYSAKHSIFLSIILRGVFPFFKNKVVHERYCEREENEWILETSSEEWL